MIRLVLICMCLIGHAPQLPAMPSTASLTFLSRFCAETGVPSALVVALVSYEDPAWDPHALHTNANGSVDQGLGQINSRYWPEFAMHAGCVDCNPLDALDNLVVTIRHLADLHARYGDWWDAVSEWNPGLGQTEANAVFAIWVKEDP